ncbi:MAG: glutathione S-transferase family protein [Hyphomicrobiales bacterium]|nr:glutathione S-transferase family protein [Hyphomicrobiales bacterium]
MKLYNAPLAPNPRRVRIFLAEKQIKVPLVDVDLGAKEHWGDRFSAMNPFQMVPVLELDDGTIISESVAICRYFEEIQPEPPLFGVGPAGKAQVEMWNRIIEHEFYRHVANAFRHSHPRMADREVPQIAELAATAPAKAMASLGKLDSVLQSRQFIAGETFSVADITGLVTLDFLKLAKLEVPAEMQAVRRWHADLRSRPSASA